MASILINDTIAIDEKEIEMSFLRASGPGGQNVNKVSSAVQLRFDVTHSPSLPDDVRWRLSNMAGRRLTNEGILVIESSRFRTQEQNRQEALDRLITLIRKATYKPKPRRRTHPTDASREQRLQGKRRRSRLKRLRRTPRDSEDN
jgi:ribosome-associated protein